MLVLFGVRVCRVELTVPRSCHPQIMASDLGAQAMVNVTEEGMKVARNHGSKYYAVYRRVADDELPTPALAQLAESMA